MTQSIAPDKPRESHQEEPKFNWLHFVERAEGEPSAWVSTYRRHRGLASQATQALTALRKGRFEEGWRVLEENARGLEALPEVPASLRSVLERWYQGALGYYYYCVGRWDEASECMSLANAAVVSAISRRRTLMPLATHCHEFRLHHARIARNQRRWAEMHHHIEQAEAMTEDRSPLCVLEDGEEVFSSSLGDYYDSLGPLAEGERATVSDSWDKARRRRRFDVFVRRLLVPPTFAILYP